MAQDRVPHIVRAQFVVDVETVIDARTPEEAESIFESEYSDDFEQVIVTDRRIEDIEAFPEAEEDIS